MSYLIGAVVLVAVHRLNVAFGIGGASHERVLARAGRRPGKFPHTPAVPNCVAGELSGIPSVPAVGRDLDSRNIVDAGPRNAAHLIRLRTYDFFGEAGVHNGGFDADGSDRKEGGIPVGPLKIGVLEGLEIPVEGLVGKRDALQPFHRCHSVPPRNDEPNRESMSRNELLTVHAEGEQNITMKRFGNGK